jgi:hypothetical protein
MSEKWLTSSFSNFKLEHYLNDFTFLKIFLNWRDDCTYQVVLIFCLKLPLIFFDEKHKILFIIIFAAKILQVIKVF